MFRIGTQQMSFIIIKGQLYLVSDSNRSAIQLTGTYAKIPPYSFLLYSNPLNRITTQTNLLAKKTSIKCQSIFS